MATDINTLEKIPVNVLQEIIEAMNISFQEELNTEDFYGKSKVNWSIPEIGIVYKNTRSIDDLRDFVFEITQTKNIRQAYAKIYERWETITKSPEYTESTFTSAPESPVDATINKIQLEELKTAQENQKQNGDIGSISDQVVREAIKQKQRIYDQKQSEIEKQKKIEEKSLEEQLFGKKVTVVSSKDPEIVTLSTEDKQKLFKLGKSAITNPTITKNIIQESIANNLEANLKNNTPQATISDSASGLVEKVKEYGKFESASEIPTYIPAAINQTSVLYPLTNYNDSKLSNIVPDEKLRYEIVKDAQTLSLALEADTIVNTSLTSTVLDSESITELLYGSETGFNTNYVISEDPSNEKEEGIQINLDDLYDNAKQIESFWNNIIKNPQSASEIIETSSALYPTYFSVTTPQITSEITSTLAGTLTSAGALAGYKYGTLLSVWEAQKYKLLIDSSIAGQLSPLSGQVFANTNMYNAAARTIYQSSNFNFTIGNFSLNMISKGTPLGNIYGIGAKFGNKAFGLSLQKSGGNLAIKFASKTLTQAGTEIIATGTGAAAGTGSGMVVGQFLVPIPLIGAAIGAFLGWVASKIPWHKIKGFINKNKEALLIVGLLGSFLVTSLPLRILFGAGAFLGAGAIIGGGGLSLGGLVLGTGVVLKNIGKFAFYNIAKGLLIFILTVPVIVALILFIINSGAYIVPPTPGGESGFSSGSGYIPNCSDEKGVVGFPGHSSSSKIANRAWEITSDLYQGFWCYWNRSPSNNPWNGPPRADFSKDIVLYPPNYPNLFDYSAYRNNPNPTEGGQNLFWCTWLVVKSYQETGVSVPVQLNSQTLKDSWTGKVIPAQEATKDNIIPGSVIFFHVTSGPNRLNHVGIVYSVDAGGIDFVQSNGPLKDQRLSFTRGGTGVGSLAFGVKPEFFGLPQ